eukprot:121424-Hanusia_phi.AAC.2
MADEGEEEPPGSRLQHRGEVRALHVSHGASFAISGGSDGKLILTGLRGSSSLTIPFFGTADSGGIGAVRFLQEGSHLVSGGGDGILSLWDYSSIFRTGSNSPELVAKFAGHKAMVLSCACSPTRPLVVSSSLDGTVRGLVAPLLWLSLSQVRIWDAHVASETGRLNRSAFSASGSASTATLALDFSPDGKFLISSGGDNLVWMWDVRQAAPARRFTGSTQELSSCRFSPTGKSNFKCLLLLTTSHYRERAGRGLY